MNDIISNSKHGHDSVEIAELIAEANSDSASEAYDTIIEKCDHLILETNLRLRNPKLSSRHRQYHFGFLNGVQAIRAYAQYRDAAVSPYTPDLVDIYLEDLNHGRFSRKNDEAIQ